MNDKNKCNQLTLTELFEGLEKHFSIVKANDDILPPTNLLEANTALSEKFNAVYEKTYIYSFLSWCLDKNNNFQINPDYEKVIPILKTDNISTFREKTNTIMHEYNQLLVKCFIKEIEESNIPQSLINLLKSENHIELAEKISKLQLLDISHETIKKVQKKHNKLTRGFLKYLNNPDKFSSDPKLTSSYQKLSKTCNGQISAAIQIIEAESEYQENNLNLLLSQNVFRNDNTDTISAEHAKLLEDFFESFDKHIKDQIDKIVKDVPNTSDKESIVYQLKNEDLEKITSWVHKQRFNPNFTAGNGRYKNLLKKLIICIGHDENYYDSILKIIDGRIRVSEITNIETILKFSPLMKNTFSKYIEKEQNWELYFYCAIENGDIELLNFLKLECPYKFIKTIGYNLNNNQSATENNSLNCFTLAHYCNSISEQWLFAQNEVKFKKYENLPEKIKFSKKDIDYAKKRKDLLIQKKAKAKNKIQFEYDNDKYYDSTYAEYQTLLNAHINWIKQQKNITQKLPKKTDYIKLIKQLNTLWNNVYRFRKIQNKCYQSVENWLTKKKNFNNEHYLPLLSWFSNQEKKDEIFEKQLFYNMLSNNAPLSLIKKYIDIINLENNFNTNEIPKQFKMDTPELQDQWNVLFDQAFKSQEIDHLNFFEKLNPSGLSNILSNKISENQLKKLNTIIRDCIRTRNTLVENVNYSSFASKDSIHIPNAIELKNILNRNGIKSYPTAYIESLDLKFSENDIEVLTNLIINYTKQNKKTINSVCNEIDWAIDTHSNLSNNKKLILLLRSNGIENISEEAFQKIHYTINFETKKLILKIIRENYQNGVFSINRNSLTPKAIKQTIKDDLNNFNDSSYKNLICAFIDNWLANKLKIDTEKEFINHSKNLSCKETIKLLSNNIKYLETESIKSFVEKSTNQNFFIAGSKFYGKSFSWLINRMSQSDLKEKIEDFDLLSIALDYRNSLAYNSMLEKLKSLGYSVDNNKIVKNSSAKIYHLNPTNKNQKNINCKKNTQSKKPLLTNEQIIKLLGAEEKSELNFWTIGNNFRKAWRKFTDNRSKNKYRKRISSINTTPENILDLWERASLEQRKLISKRLDLDTCDFLGVGFMNPKKEYNVFNRPLEQISKIKFPPTIESGQALNNEIQNFINQCRSFKGNNGDILVETNSQLYQIILEMEKLFITVFDPENKCSDREKLKQIRSFAHKKQLHINQLSYSLIHYALAFLMLSALFISAFAVFTSISLATAFVVYPAMFIFTYSFIDAAIATIAVAAFFDIFASLFIAWPNVNQNVQKAMLAIDSSFETNAGPIQQNIQGSIDRIFNYIFQFYNAQKNQPTTLTTPHDEKPTENQENNKGEKDTKSNNQIKNASKFANQHQLFFNYPGNAETTEILSTDGVNLNQSEKPNIFFFENAPDTNAQSHNFIKTMAKDFAAPDHWVLPSKC